MGRFSLPAKWRTEFGPAHRYNGVMPRSIQVRDLGLTGYGEVHALQHQLRAGRHEPGAVDTLLLTEHRPVVTLGRAHPVPDLRVPREVLDREGIDIIQAERGGDITYHGPGQLVAYGIIDLRAWDLPLLDYVSGLETTAIRTFARWGVTASQKPGARGAWVGDRKAASIGIHVRRWVTMHGIALNVAPEMRHFALINPCGMADIEMTSLAAEAGCAPAMEMVKQAFIEEFAAVFACCVMSATPE
jgi:lipoate-protein ligase B